MPTYTIINAAGGPEGKIHVLDFVSALMQLHEDGQSVVEGEAPPDTYWDGQAWMPRPVQPSYYHVWTAEGWVDARQLETIRQAKREQINAWRLQANRRTFSFMGKAIACDELSRSDIDGVTSQVTLTGALPPDFPGGWKAVDNSYVPIPDVATWTALVSAMVAQGTANFLRSQGLKALLESYTTAAQIESLTWETALS